MCDALGCVVVQQDVVKLTEQFGRFDQILRPGLHFVWPCLCQTVAGTLSTRIQQCEIRAEAKTKDDVFVTLRVAVQYRINMEDNSTIFNANYKLSNHVQQIEAFVYDVVRSSVPKIDLDDVFVSKDEISKDIKGQLCMQMADFGFVILASPIIEIEPDAKVKQAMNEINRAKRMLTVAEDEGEATKARVLKDAEAAAAATEIQAKAEAESKYHAGEGIARQRQAIISGMHEAVNGFTSGVDGIDAKSVMDLMIVTQHFDLMKEVGERSRTNALFIDPTPGSLNRLADQVRAGFMGGAPGSSGMSRDGQGCGQQ